MRAESVGAKSDSLSVLLFPLLSLCFYALNSYKPLFLITNVQNFKKEDKEIRAYKNDIWAVTLDLDQLNKIGFVIESG